MTSPTEAPGDAKLISLEIRHNAAKRIVVSALNATYHSEPFGFRQADNDRLVLRRAMYDLWELLRDA